MAVVKGAARSRTIRLGLAIIVMGYLQANLPLVEKLVGSFMDKETVDLVMAAITMLLGLGVVVMRFLTTESLQAKGQGDGS